MSHAKKSSDTDFGLYSSLADYNSNSEVDRVAKLTAMTRLSDPHHSLARQQQPYAPTNASRPAYGGSGYSSVSGTGSATESVGNYFTLGSAYGGR